MLKLRLANGVQIPTAATHTRAEHAGCLERKRWPRLGLKLPGRGRLPGHMATDLARETSARMSCVTLQVKPEDPPSPEAAPSETMSETASVPPTHPPVDVAPIPPADMGCAMG